MNDPVCGRPPNSNRRVLDGEPAGFGSFPWQALIRVGKGKCGGVLVDRRHVVTAGHCVKNKVLSSIAVTLGEYHLKSSREPLPSQSYRYFSLFSIKKPLSDGFFIPSLIYIFALFSSIL